MDIFNYLHRDHANIREAIIELQTNVCGFRERQAVFSRLVREVNAHARAEQAVVLLYALANTEKGDELRNHALKSMQEHDLSEGFANTFVFSRDSRKDAYQEVWEAQVNVYIEIVERQIENEERYLFPELHERLSETERADMGYRYLQALNASRTAVPRRETRINNHWLHSTGT
jgi:hypothetical protein